METGGRVFYLEDETTIREVLSAYLELAGYEVHTAATGDDALRILASECFDLAVLDIMVPGPSGLEVLDFIRQRWPHMATIVLTALEDEKTELEAFNHAADDFVSKPVSPIILLKRIAAILRRTKLRFAESTSAGETAAFLRKETRLTQQDLTVSAEDGKGQAGESVQLFSPAVGLQLRPEAYSAYFDGVALPLTLSEFILLKTLAENPRRVLNREQLIDALYDGDYYGSDRVIDSHIKNLRKKLPRAFVKTVIGVGYQFDEGA